MKCNQLFPGWIEELNGGWIPGLIVVLIMLTSFLIGGCSGGSDGVGSWTGSTVSFEGSLPSDQGPVKIGWIGPLSGPAAALGIDAALAAQLAVERVNAQGGINGVALELIVEDDQYETPKTISAYHKLADEGVISIIIYTYGSVFSLSSQAKEDGITLIDPLDCERNIADLGSHVFCISPLTEEKAGVLSQRADEMNLKSMGVLYNDADSFMPNIKTFFEEKYSGKVSAEAYHGHVDDFKTPLLKIMSTMNLINTNVSGLLFLGYDEVGIGMRQARELGFSGPFFAVATVNSPAVAKASAGASEGTYFGSWSTPDSADATSFAAKFRERQGRDPLLAFVTYTTYDTVGIIAEALRNAEAKGLNSPESFQSSLSSTKNFQGVTGNLSFDDVGAARIPLEVYQIKNGKPARFADQGHGDQK